MLHNESVNIWSHLLAALFFFWILLNSIFFIEPTLESGITYLVDDGFDVAFNHSSTFTSCDFDMHAMNNHSVILHHTTGELINIWREEIKFLHSEPKFNKSSQSIDDSINKKIGMTYLELDKINQHKDELLTKVESYISSVVVNMKQYSESVK